MLIDGEVGCHSAGCAALVQSKEAWARMPYATLVVGASLDLARLGATQGGL